MEINSTELKGDFGNWNVLSEPNISEITENTEKKVISGGYTEESNIQMES